MHRRRRDPPLSGAFGGVFARIERAAPLTDRQGGHTPTRFMQVGVGACRGNSCALRSIFLSAVRGVAVVVPEDVSL